MGILTWSGNMTYFDGAVRAHPNAIDHEGLHTASVDHRLHDMISFIPYCILYWGDVVQKECEDILWDMI